MIEIKTAEQVRCLLPSPLQRTPVRPLCPVCGGKGKIVMNKSGLVGDFVRKRCKACKGKS
jgi:DnaJ-class molecular chaperone